MTSTVDGAPVVLKLTRITKRFGALTANDDVSLDLHRGEILALLGENGAGKTTLMNILFGHYVADEGTVEVAGTDGALQELEPGSPHASLNAGIGMVHQHFTLAENLSALENILLGTEALSSFRSARGKARKRLTDLMQRSGLTVDLNARISSLSVGEKQRVEILKALYRDARVLVLDEPTAVLTPQESDTTVCHLEEARRRRSRHHLHFPQAGRGACGFRPDRCPARWLQGGGSTDRRLRQAPSSPN